MKEVNKDMVVYLAGYISGRKIKECSEWRIKIRDHYNKWKEGERYPIIWLDPLNGKEYLTIDKEGLKSSIPPNAIVHRDYRCIEESDLIIANMDTFGDIRTLTGTICELAWAWQLHKPIVMITIEDKYKLHPFMTYFASWIVPDVKTLLDEKIINYFYKGLHSAIY